MNRLTLLISLLSVTSNIFVETSGLVPYIHNEIFHNTLGIQERIDCKNLSTPTAIK